MVKKQKQNQYFGSAWVFDWFVLSEGVFMEMYMETGIMHRK